ncbi:MAG: gliding motility-associated C-terminal domain-containing protein [Bacteroidales bacterium]|nr:gliding motility-associated C-terminal domain-containing protein [Bacteroidales bacterium]
MKNLINAFIIILIVISSCSKNDNKNQSGSNDKQYFLSDDICECCNQYPIQILNNDTLGITNAITPNGDGFNDHFIILGIEAITENSIKFMDRNNNVLIQFSPYNNNWNGTYNFNGSTVTADNGKYYFELTAGSQTIKGAILLISSIYLSEPYFDIKPSEANCDKVCDLFDANDPIFY